MTIDPKALHQIFTLLPEASYDYDNEGQLIIYTNIYKEQE